MTKFIHGQPVRVIVPSGRDAVGVLHLPDVVMHGRRGSELLPRETSGGYVVHTIRMPDGSLFRTEGRLAHP